MEYPKFGNYMLDDPDCEETPYEKEIEEADEEVSE